MVPVRTWMSSVCECQLVVTVPHVKYGLLCALRAECKTDT